MATRLGLVCIAASLIGSPALAEDLLVRTQAAYSAALEQAEPGDTIILANGEWRDFDMVVLGNGRADAPLTVTAQQAGKVFLTGQSSLRMGGEHLVVSNLVFKDGYSPRGETVSYRVSDAVLASNSRVTGVVIDGFSKPDRYESDYWVGIYGRNNRFDHNHLSGKSNKGVTLAVRLNSEESRENNHRIDHNYFGPRATLGSNGGETLRIGTSAYSMFNANTVVERNVFDRTSGEVEIISSKSGGNVFRENVFLRAKGNLTLRHGDNNVVERNVFLGDGQDYTGGIRVINRGQTVRQNYMEGLRGAAFSSALAVMNGVPNSPVNRYVEVEGARISNNTIVDSAAIGFGIGADEERSARPSNSTFTANLLGGADAGPFVEAFDDMSGIAFANNRVIQGQVDAALPGLPVAPAELQRAGNGLLYPVAAELASIGAPSDLAPVALAEVGAPYYPKAEEREPFGFAGKTTRVYPGGTSLFDAIAQACAGEVLLLTPGDYVLDRTIALDKPLTLRGDAADTADRPVIRFSRPSLIELREGGDLQLQNLVIDGELAPDSVGNAVIRTSTFPIQSNIDIELDGVDVRGLNVNKSFHVLALGKSSLADRVKITGSSFTDISGAVVLAAAETEDYGQYNVDYLDITGSSFTDIGGPIANIYRGGRDESTFGPNVTITGNTLTNVGSAATNGPGASINLHGVQIADVSGNAVRDSAPLRVVHTVGTPKTSIRGNVFTGTPESVLEELNFGGAFRAEMSGNVAGGGVQ